MIMTMNGDLGPIVDYISPMVIILRITHIIPIGIHSIMIITGIILTIPHITGDIDHIIGIITTEITGMAITTIIAITTTTQEHIEMESIMHQAL